MDKPTATIPEADRAFVEQVARAAANGTLERLAAIRVSKDEKWDASKRYLNLSWSPYSLHRAYKKKCEVRRLRQRGGVMLANPSESMVHIDTALTNISVAYRNPLFLGAEIFPQVNVQKRTGKWFTFGKGEWGRAENGLRGYADEAVTVGYTMSTASYSVEERSWQMPLDIRLLNNADPGAAPEAVAAEFVANQDYLDKEQVVQALTMTAANWDNTVTLSGTSQWSDYSGTSDPITDILNAHDAIIKATMGTAPNTVVMGLSVFLKLLRHPKLLDLIKYGGTDENPAIVTTRALAQLFRVDRVLVGQTVKNTANEGAAYAAAYTWGKDVWVGYVEPNPSLMRPSAGYIFSLGMMTDRFWWPIHKALYVRASEDYDARVTASAAGYTIKAAVG